MYIIAECHRASRRKKNHESAKKERSKTAHNENDHSGERAKAKNSEKKRAHVHAWLAFVHEIIIYNFQFLTS